MNSWSTHSGKSLDRWDFKMATSSSSNSKNSRYHAGIRSNNQLMLHQIKKAAHQTSKNTIYSADGDVPTDYDGVESSLNPKLTSTWHLKQAEGITPATTRPQTQKMTTPTRGGQTAAPVASTTTATGTTYGGRGMPMDIDAVKAAVAMGQMLWMWQNRPLQTWLPKASKNLGWGITTL